MDPIYIQAGVILVLLVGVWLWGDYEGNKAGYEAGYHDATRNFILALQRNNETLIVDENGVCKIIGMGKTKITMSDDNES